LRHELKNLSDNKFQDLCENHQKLVSTVNELDVAKVQNCLTSHMCKSCNSPTTDEKMGNEPVINIFESIKGVNLNEYCFGDDHADYNLSCLKAIPLLFRSFKAAYKLLNLTKQFHGSVSLQSL